MATEAKLKIGAQGASLAYTDGALPPGYASDAVAAFSKIPHDQGAGMP